MNPSAPILQYGFYNTLYDGHPVKNALGEDCDEFCNSLNGIIQRINFAILNETIPIGYQDDGHGNVIPIFHPITGMTSYMGYFNDLYYVDAFIALEFYAMNPLNDKADLFLDEVHPSELGQVILFQAALKVFMEEVFAHGGAAVGF